MTWYAIRTEPGAQMPKREYIVENSPRSRKGYRIVPSLNANVSAVERALSDAGFSHYMPVQRKVIKDRKQAFTYTTRRFALLPGYVFVQDAWQWEALERVPGVIGVVKNQGRPLTVAASDIDMLRQAEQKAEAACEAEIQARVEAATRPTRDKLGRAFPRGSSVLVVKGPMKDRRATVRGVARDGKIQAFLDGLDALGTITLPASALDLVDAA